MGIPLATPAVLTPPAGDQANAVLIGNLTTVVAGSWFPVYGDFNASLYGTFSGTVKLEKTYDAGTTAIPVFFNGGTVAASFTAPMSQMFAEPERGVSYRFDCTVYTSGTIAYRFSTSGLMAQSEGWR